MGHVVRTALRRIEGRVGYPLRVLVYHRVESPAVDPWGMAVSPLHFEEQLAALSARGHVLPLLPALASSRAKLPARTRRFVLTFDDGYADNLLQLVPRLELHDAPATIFVAPRFIDQAYFWWDRLAEVALGPGSDAARCVTAARQIGLVDQPVAEQLGSDGTPEQVHERLYRALATRPFDERNELLDEIAGALRSAPPDAGSRPLSSTQLCDLAAHPLITIGNHTLSHQRLTALPAVEAWQEISLGQQRLDDLLGPARRRPFAYPHGAADRATATLVRRAGHDLAFTTVPRPISVSDRALLLPRIATSDISGEEFSRRRGL